MNKTVISNEIDFNKIFKVLILYKRQILVFPVISFLSAVLYCLVVTPLYTTSIIINPPKLTDAGSGLSSMILGTAMPGLMFAGLQHSDLDTVIALCKTNYVENQIVTKYNLNKNKKNIIDGRSILEKKVQFFDDKKSGFLTISVTDKNPELAAKIANYYVIALGELISKIASGKTNNKVIFLENRLSSAWRDLVSAQNDITKFSKEHGILAGQQIKVVETLVSNLQSQLVIAQTQLSSISSYATSNNPDYQRLQSQISSIKEQLLNLNDGSASNDQIAIPANLAPAYSQQYSDLIRNLIAHEEVYRALFKQYQLSKLDQISELVPTSVELIDSAEVPIYKSSPKRIKIVIISTFLGLLIGGLYTIIKNREQIISNKN